MENEKKSFILSDSFFKKWPNCTRNDCNLKSCIALDSPYCYPHTIEMAIVSLQEFDKIIKYSQKILDHAKRGYDE